MESSDVALNWNAILAVP